MRGSNEYYNVPEDGFTPSILRVLVVLQLRLNSSGWRVGARRLDDGQVNKQVEVSFSHPVACPFSLHLDQDLHEGRVIELLLAQLDEHEVVVTRSLPEVVLHPVLMRELRIAADACGWSPEILRQVLIPLYRAGSLTLDEAEWIMQVGPRLRPGQVWMPQPFVEIAGSNESVA